MRTGMKTVKSTTDPKKAKHYIQEAKTLTLTTGVEHEAWWVGNERVWKIVRKG